MSITVATSTSDLSWQEIDVVEFTAGTLATITECITEVQDRLQRGTLSTDTTPTTTQVQKWLIRAKEQLAAIRNFSFGRRYAYATTTAGTYRMALPPDFRGGNVKLRDVSSGYSPKEIPLFNTAVFDNNFPDPSYSGSDRPYAGCIKNLELWVYPPPDTTYTYELEYSRSGADQTTTDMSWIPEFYRWMCCDYATWHSFVTLKEFDSAQMWRAEWENNLGISRVSDGKQKWATHEFQCPIWVK